MSRAIVDTPSHGGVAWTWPAIWSTRWFWRRAAAGRSPARTESPRAGWPRSSPVIDPAATTRSRRAPRAPRRSPIAALPNSRTASCGSAKSSPMTASMPAPRRSTTTSRSAIRRRRLCRRSGASSNGGFVTPQPHKRPRSSYSSFEASLPNEMWQSDVTFFELKDGTKVEICNFLDDFSRVCVASKVFAVTTAPDVVATLYEAGSVWGLPASLLTDNGCIYTAAYRHGYSAMESELFHLGIDYKHSRPYHPQTCGKVERFHQTLKKFLRKQPRAKTVTELQAQVDRFVAYYNEVRPHRAKGRKTPRSAFESRAKARPIKREGAFTRELRVRHDVVDSQGKVTLRYKSKLHHIGMGRALKGTRIILLVAGRNVRIITTQGQLLRDFELDPSHDYQPQDLG